MAARKTNPTVGGNGGMADDVKNTAGQVFDQAREKAGEVADRTQRTAKSQLTGQKDRLAEGMDTVALALQRTGQQLQDEDMGVVGDYVTRAADRLSDVSHRLRENDVEQLLRDVEGFARREPAIFLGGAFAIGIIAARFLKSSSGGYRRDESAYSPYGDTFEAQAYGRTYQPTYTSEMNRDLDRDRTRGAGTAYGTGGTIGGGMGAGMPPSTTQGAPGSATPGAPNVYGGGADMGPSGPASAGTPAGSDIERRNRPNAAGES